MLLIVLIALGAGWCSHQHWMRLAEGKGLSGERFWLWVLQGFVFPTLVWAFVNLGLSDRFPAFVPELVLAQAGRRPWFWLWMNACLGGAALIALYWAAVTYLWLFGVMLSRAENKAEFAFNVATFGVFFGGAAALLLYAGGTLHAGSAVIITLLPIVHLTMDLAERPPVLPTYARAVAQIKRGKYTDAEWEVISQLEKAENDFTGWIMLAELYAKQFNKMEDAARVILDLCNDSGTQPVQISLACHELADWQMEIGENPAAARAALELLCRKLPGTHFARMAQQRIKQLPRTTAELQESKTPKRIRLPALRENLDGSVTAAKVRSVNDATVEANRLVERLTEDPDDISVRENLAAILALELGHVNLGIEQLQLLTELPEALDEQKAKWLAQMAAWELNLNGNEEKFRLTLKQIIREYPQTSQAFAAQRQLFLLDMNQKVAG
jgi:hypothetical protein